MTYEEVKDTLKANAPHLVPTVFDYRPECQAEEFTLFLKFCNVNLQLLAVEEPKMKDSCMFFRKDEKVDAIAKNSFGYKTIGINHGVFIKLDAFFQCKGNMYDQEELAKYQFMAKFLNRPLPDIMFQIATLFVFYHERTHLQHFCNLEEGEKSEQYAIGSSKTPYDEESHAAEFDADEQAAYWCTLHCIEYWKELPPQIQNGLTLTMLLAVGIAGIVSYWMFLIGENFEMYYTNGDHPHCANRLLYTADIMVKVAEENCPLTIKISGHQVIQEVFKLVDYLYERVDQNPIQRFAAIFFANRYLMEKYINDLIQSCAQYPYLLHNLQHK